MSRDEIKSALEDSDWTVKRTFLENLEEIVISEMQEDARSVAPAWEVFHASDDQATRAYDKTIANP